MKITAIKQQVKNPERVSVFVDGKYEFSLSLDELLQQKLKNDDELDKDDVKRLKKISADGKLRMRSMEWLLNRPHSTREFRDYLYRKKAEPELIESFIKDFSERAYLDDQKFGEWFIELQKRRAKSNRAIRSELFKKGISRELADELFAEEMDDEVERLKKIIEKKQKSSRYKNDPLKLKQYLAAQGFSYDLIKEMLD
ncbi:MAG TPA: RecX family transcriptional regulator [Candidatus Saccharimonadales bacterium]|nr:RecX family transcriptional regulator [Candidatus Saccharimonadales bacterium]